MTPARRTSPRGLPPNDVEIDAQVRRFMDRLD
jgi:hypothetical protein